MFPGWVVMIRGGYGDDMTSRILLVEDDPLVAMMIEGFLEAVDRQITGTEETTAGALARISSEDFDAAIIDVHLANGETSEPIAEALRARNIPFVVMTGDAAAIGRDYAGAPVLRKPFAIACLEAALTQIGA